MSNRPKKSYGILKVMMWMVIVTFLIYGIAFHYYIHRYSTIKSEEIGQANTENARFPSVQPKSEPSDRIELPVQQKAEKQHDTINFFHDSLTPTCNEDKQLYLENLLFEDTKNAKKNPVLLVVDDDDDLQNIAPLFKEFTHSHLSKYVPILALNQDVLIEPKEAVKMLSLGLDEQDFICRAHWFKEYAVEGLETVVTEFEPAAIITASGNGFIPRLVEIIADEHDLPYLMIPAPELRFVKWLAHCPIEVFQNWYIPTFRISIITATRPNSLLRLLLSLRRSYYLGDNIDLIINMESIADKDTISISHRAKWPFGEKIIRHRVNQGGLIAAVTESWYPGSFDEYGILLEDDIEVSKFFFVWCRYNLMQYVYGSPENQEGGLFGISLYTPRKNELITGKPRWNSNEFFFNHTGHRHTVYIQPLPCSWGAIYFPTVWMTFHHYLMYRQGTGKKVEIKGSLTNGWSASWKKYFIEMADTFGLYMIYPNFENQTSFSTNHLGEGVHIKSAGGDATHLAIDYTVPLFLESGFEDIFAQLPGNSLPEISNLAAMSLLGEFIDTKTFLKNKRSKFDFANFVTSAGKDLENDALESDGPYTNIKNKKKQRKSNVKNIKGWGKQVKI